MALERLLIAIKDQPGGRHPLTEVCS